MEKKCTPGNHRMVIVIDSLFIIKSIDHANLPLLLQLTPEMLIGQSFEELPIFVSPSNHGNATWLVHHIERAYRERRQICFEMMSVSHDGHENYACVCAAYTPEGEVHCYFVTTTVDDLIQGRIEQPLKANKEVRPLDIAHKQKSDIAIQAADLMMWEYDNRTQLFTCNNEPLNEFDENRLLTEQDYCNVAHPEDLETVKNNIESMRLGVADSFCFDARFHLKEGNDWEYATMSGSPFERDANGRVLRYVGIRRNNTEMRKRQNLLRFILDNIPVPLHIKDMEDAGKYIFWNEESRKMFGEGASKVARQMLSPALAKKIEEIDQWVYNTGRPYWGEEQIVMLNGRKYDTLVRKSVLNYEGKRLLMVARWDISEQRRTEIALLRSENELLRINRQNELVLNNTHSGLAFIDTDYIVKWENLSVCSENVVSGGYKQGELCYKSAYGRTEPCEECLLKLAIETKSLEKKIVDMPNGSSFEIYATPVLNERNLVEGIVIRVDNITERRRMIRDLESAKQKAEQSDKLKSAFLANMTHEIRTPLNAIIGFSELLMISQNETEREEFSHIIKVNNEVLLKLVNDILDLSKIEAGLLDFEDQLFDVSEFVEELIWSAQIETTPTVKFISKKDFGHCFVSLDKVRLAQIMTNFLKNANKYTTKGFIELGYKYENEALFLYVKDSGCGISEEGKKVIFERFEKLNSYIQGAGLGLCLTKALTEAMGGTIGFESEEGVGSTFWISIPCVRQKELIGL